MSNLTDIHPKIFISYAWANNNTTSFVLHLSERLSAHGVEVILDRWSLKEGQDKYSFMEKTVNDASITNVLLVCDKAYKERADARRGGVGDETTVITPEIYGNASQTKFIPILWNAMITEMIICRLTLNRDYTLIFPTKMITNPPTKNYCAACTINRVINNHRWGNRQHG